MIQLNLATAKKQLAMLDCSIDHKALRGLLYILNRAGRKITDGCFVEKSGMERIKQLI